MKSIYTLQQVSIPTGAKRQILAPFGSKRQAIKAAKEQNTVPRTYIEVLASTVGVTPHRFCVFATAAAI